MVEIEPDEIEQVKVLPGNAVEVTFEDGSQRIFSGSDAREVLRLWAELFKPETPEA
jgi:hypothetical protein